MATSRGLSASSTLAGNGCKHPPQTTNALADGLARGERVEYREADGAPCSRSGRMPEQAATDAADGTRMFAAQENVGQMSETRPALPIEPLCACAVARADGRASEGREGRLSPRSPPRPHLSISSQRGRSLKRAAEGFSKALRSSFTLVPPCGGDRSREVEPGCWIVCSDVSEGTTKLHACVRRARADSGALVGREPHGQPPSDRRNVRRARRLARRRGTPRGTLGHPGHHSQERLAPGAFERTASFERTAAG